MNLLEDWLEAMKLYKWRNAIESPYFSKEKLEYIAGNIAKYFPDKIYMGNERNWLANFLAKKDPTLIGFAIQLSKLIDYYYQLNAEAGYTINPKKKSIQQVRDLFFELFVNYILSRNNITVKVNDKYYIHSDDGNAPIKKPLDCSILFNGKTYIVECKKLYNIETEYLAETITEIVKNVVVDEKGNKKAPYGDTTPNGYVFFKNKGKSNKLIESVKSGFRDCYNEFLKGMALDKNILTPKVIKRSDDYEICIESSIFNNFEKFEKMADEFPLAVLFNSRVVNFRTGAVKFGIQAIHKYTESDITNKLCAIIKDKISQHESSSLHKIIIVDFEEEISVSTLATLYFDINELKAERIEHLLKDDVSIMLLSRKHQQGKSWIKLRLFQSKGLDQALAAKLLSLDLTV